MMPVSIDSAGFRVVTPSTGRAVYVATSGNDANSGLTTSLPKRTLAAAYATLRNGFDDQVLLRRGDTWNETPPELAIAESGTTWWGGPSAANPMLIGAWSPSGTHSEAAPRVIVGTADDTGGIRIFYRRVQHIVIQSIYFDSGTSAQTPLSVGCHIFGRTSNGIIVEDCDFTRFRGGIIIQGHDAAQFIDGVTFKRCRVYDNFVTDHSQGIYAQHCNGLTLDECFFDRNGWSGSSGDTVFAHNFYFHKTVTNFTVRNCISARPSANGISTNTGGTLEGNLIIDAPLGMVCRPAGTLVKNNTVIGTRSINGSAVAIGIECQVQWGVDDGLPVTPIGPLNLDGNFVLQSGTSGQDSVLRRVTPTSETGTVVYRWENPSQSPAGFPDTTRTVPTYAASVGLTGTTAAFLAACRASRRGAWSTNYTAAVASAWIRAGYQATASVTPSPGYYRHLIEAMV